MSLSTKDAKAYVIYEAVTNLLAFSGIYPEQSSHAIGLLECTRDEIDDDASRDNADSVDAEAQKLMRAVFAYLSACANQHPLGVPGMRNPTHSKE